MSTDGTLRYTVLGCGMYLARSPSESEAGLDGSPMTRTFSPLLMCARTLSGLLTSKLVTPASLPGPRRPVLEDIRLTPPMSSLRVRLFGFARAPSRSCHKGRGGRDIFEDEIATGVGEAAL